MCTSRRVYCTISVSITLNNIIMIIKWSCVTVALRCKTPIRLFLIASSVVGLCTEIASWHVKIDKYKKNCIK